MKVGLHLINLVVWMVKKDDRYPASDMERFYTRDGDILENKIGEWFDNDGNTGYMIATQDFMAFDYRETAYLKPARSNKRWESDFLDEYIQDVGFGEIVNMANMIGIRQFVDSDIPAVFRHINKYVSIPCVIVSKHTDPMQCGDAGTSDGGVDVEWGGILQEFTYSKFITEGLG